MGNFWLAEKLLASHDGLSCMDLVSSEHISCNVLNKERNWMRQEREVRGWVWSGFSASSWANWGYQLNRTSGIFVSGYEGTRI